jgi:hypothetical protein
MPTKSGPIRMAWDATVTIDFLNRTPEPIDLYPSLRAIVEDAKAKNVELVVSTLAYAETYRLDGCDPVEQRRRIDAFFDSSFLRIYAFEMYVAQKASEIRRIHKMRSVDGAHIATAVIADCDYFLTDDGNAQRTTRNLLNYNELIDVGDGANQRKLKIWTPAQYDLSMTKIKFPLMAEAPKESVSMPSPPTEEAQPIERANEIGANNG